MLKALYNAKIYIEEGYFKQAILIDSDRIAMVGSNEDIRTAFLLVGGRISGEEIDCGGRTVLPGFNDSHNHFIYWGRQMSEANITGSTSIDDLISRCKGFLERNPCLSSMHALGWNQDLFTEGEKRMPCRKDLDLISTDIPIVLERICAHIAVANSKAMKLLGIVEGTSQWKSGIFAEKDCEPLLRILPPPTINDHRNHFLTAMEQAVSMGLTSVQSNDLGVIGDNYKAILEMMDDVYTQGEGLLRYRHQVYCTSLSQLQDKLAAGIFHRKEDPHAMHQVGPLKLYKDGSLGGRTALLRRQYPGEPGNMGVSAMSQEDCLASCALAAKNNVQVLVHAIGDGAIEEVLGIFEKTMAPENPFRNGIVHCQITDLPLLKRIAHDRVLIQYQPIFLNSDLHILEELVGEELASTSYAFRTAIEGAHSSNLISFGTDAPVESCNPFENIYCAITRRDLSGYPAEGFFPKERVSVPQAVDAYTVAGAYAEFQEDRKGRLKPGYFADLIVTDADIFSVHPGDIRYIRPVMTIVGGKTVHHNNFT